MNTGWPSSVPNHLRWREREERKEELEGGGEDGAGLAGVSWLWSLLAQRNDEQHGPISICLLPVSLQPTGTSTICHCRMLDRPHASKHFNTAQPTSNHPRGWDHGQEAASDLYLFHVQHTMNESIRALAPFHVHLTPGENKRCANRLIVRRFWPFCCYLGEKHINERKRTNNKAGNEWLQALENRLIGQMGRALERTKWLFKQKRILCF